MSEDYNFNKVLDEVKGMKKTLSFFSPSKGKMEKIYPLSLKQQKVIIENSLSSSLSILFFNNCIYDIINENYEGNINDLNTLDRVSICLTLRQKIKDSYTDENDNEVSLEKIIKSIKDEISIEDKVIELEDFKFHLSIPNLTIDNKINKLLLNKYKNKKIDDNNIKNVVSDLYVYESIKFIDKFEIYGDKVTTINVKENINDSIQIFNEIDSDIFKEVYDYINILRDGEASLAKTPDGSDNVYITPDFFIVQ